jgi:hypothetical protein
MKNSNAFLDGELDAGKGTNHAKYGNLVQGRNRSG